MTDLPTIRISSLANKRLCGGFQGQPGGLAAEQGTALHAAVTAWIDNGDWPDFRDPEKQRLAVRAIGIWKDHLAEYFPTPDVEQTVDCELGGFFLLGHVDVIQVSATHISIADFKFGYKESDYSGQMLGYALAVSLMFRMPQVSVSIIWVRSGEVETTVYGEEEIDAFERNLLEQLERPVVRAGDYCANCSLQNDCPACKALVLRARELTGVQLEEALPLASPESIIDMWSALAVAEKQMESMKALIRKHVVEHGPLEAPNGQTLAAKEKELREVVGEVAFLPLVAMFGSDKVASIMKFSVGDIAEIAKDNAPRGMKKTAINDVMTGLEDAGAIVRRSQTTVSVTGKKTKLVEASDE